MKDCRHKYVFRCEDGYIPHYQQGTTTNVNNYNYAAVKQYECLCCETKFAENCIPISSTKIEYPKTIT